MAANTVGVLLLAKLVILICSRTETVIKSFLPKCKQPALKKLLLGTMASICLMMLCLTKQLLLNTLANIWLM